MYIHTLVHFYKLILKRSNITIRIPFVIQITEVRINGYILGLNGYFIHLLRFKGRVHISIEVIFDFL